MKDESALEETLEVLRCPCEIPALLPPPVLRTVQQHIITRCIVDVIEKSLFTAV